MIIKCCKTNLYSLSLRGGAKLRRQFYIVMQAENLISNRDSRCEILESPRKLYDNLLLYVYNNLGNEEKDIFTFSFRGDLPSKVLECRNPLTWFCTLEQRERLSCNDINSLVNYLKEASRQDLVSEARYYQARIRVIRFFQKHLEAGTIAGRKIRLGWYIK